LWDEGFYVLEGEVTVQAGDQLITATPGMFVFAAREVAHTFANLSEEDARILVGFIPAGFERYLAGEVSREEVATLLRERRGEGELGQNAG
jgi:quercetin dioxygenase-like cupin family protein